MNSDSHPFHVHSHQTHLRWDQDIPPVLTVDSGSEINFDLRDGGNNQFTENSTINDMAQFSFDLADPATGPVYIRGAEPGDVLKVDFLELKTASFGWTAIFPGFGLLAEDFPDNQLKVWDLQSIDGFALFKDGIQIPIRPFLGVVGVARAETGEFSTIPPYDTGGNMDCRHTTVGSTLYLPVKVTGALFSCGDGHAAQGDGEVCGTAIETPMKARLRLTVEKNMPWVKSPHIVTSKEDKALSDTREYTVLGIDTDLLQASKKAVRSLIDWLVGTKGLTPVESYMLASVAANLKIAEIVDMPHFAVACSLPLGIFVGAQSM